MHNKQLQSRAKELRTNQTETEKKLWYRLRANGFENRKFYRQYVIEPHIVDFVQRDLKLVIELDGGQHSDSAEKDEFRAEHLKKLGYKVIRFWNNDVVDNFEGVLSTLSLVLSQREREVNTASKNTQIPTFSPEFALRRAHRNNSPHVDVWNILDQVYDPELPGLTIWDLGILQDVKQQDSQIEVVVTPTYSGCPAVDTINSDIKSALANNGYPQVKVTVTLSPAWSTEMMSPQGKAHLKSIHIAPPNKDDIVCCPVCESGMTKLISQFGSTACKSLYQCNDCSEVFDYFKHF